MPLALLSGARAEQAIKQAPATVLARITGARKGAIVDGMSDDGTCDRLLTMVLGAEEVATPLGRLQGARLLAADAGGESPAAEARKWTRGPGDQSNTVAFVDERYVMKLVRRLERGPHPELEIQRELAERGFTRAPALVGALHYNDNQSESASGTLALVQKYVTHQGSGWEYTVNELRRYYELVSARTQPIEEAAQQEPPPFFLAMQRWYLHSAVMLGRRTGELHLALADPAKPAFAAGAIRCASARDARRRDARPRGSRPRSAREPPRDVIGRRGASGRGDS